MDFLSDLKRFCETTAEAASAVFGVLGRAVGICFGIAYFAFLAVCAALFLLFLYGVGYCIYIGFWPLLKMGLDHLYSNYSFLEATGRLLMYVVATIAAAPVFAALGWLVDGCNDGGKAARLREQRQAEDAWLLEQQRRMRAK